MDLWLELSVALLAAAAGVFLGWMFSKLRSPYWTIGYFLPLGLIGLFFIAHQWPQYGIVPPFSWIILGRRKLIIGGFVSTLILTTPLNRLHRKQARMLLCALMLILVFGISVMPFLSPLYDRAELLRLKTDIDVNGVCLQSTDYTCGAAAAVTGLRKLGFPAEEGEIAVLARTSYMDGTEADILAEALQRRYGPDGLIAEYRFFKNIEELKAAGLTLVVVKYGPLVDHFITVFKVTDDSVIVGDPCAGMVALSREHFMKEWRRVGVVLSRRGAKSGLERGIHSASP